MPKRIKMKVREILCCIMPAIPLAVTGCSSGPEKKIDSGIVPYAQYIAGCSLLHTLPPEYGKREASLYRDLMKISGVQAADALAFLGRIRDDPATTKKLYQAMQQAFTAPADSAKKHL